MKKIIYLFFFIPLMINLAACYDDTGNYDYTDLPDVDIKMQDTVYATQFKTLELTADVDLNDAPESDYEFNWRIWSNEIGGVWEQKEIGNSRNLTYEVAEIPGSYTLVLTVTNKKTEVKTHKQIYLAVQGSITEGWMVLQEKEGKTDFDLIMSPYFSNSGLSAEPKPRNWERGPKTRQPPPPPQGYSIPPAASDEATTGKPGSKEGSQQKSKSQFSPYAAGQNERSRPHRSSVPAGKTRGYPVPSGGAGGEAQRPRQSPQPHQPEISGPKWPPP